MLDLEREGATHEPRSWKGGDHQRQRGSTKTPPDVVVGQGRVSPAYATQRAGRGRAETEAESVACVVTVHAEMTVDTSPVPDGARPKTLGPGTACWGRALTAVVPPVWREMDSDSTSPLELHDTDAARGGNR
ncbi:hypothetical protein CTE05_33270 [Cellulomonas terrae]|uniref:Uncharacterized protein n=1 Tax=Cellulomonas terrae TaxID=311234 RepID=A0A511JP18_9CELL|nr:hypothetical protein CTE05_33270 [Cellulomonas terrae]